MRNKIRYLMLVAMFSTCACIMGVIDAGASGLDDAVRVPMVTHTREEAESIRHLNHARRLLVEAQKEIKKARMLKDWPDRDWTHMRAAISGYAKSLESFTFPTYHSRLYPEGGKTNVLDTSLSEADIYPNGEDVLPNR